MSIQERVRIKRKGDGDIGGSDEFGGLAEELSDTPGIDEVKRALDNDLGVINFMINRTQDKIERKKNQGSTRKRDDCSC